MPGKLMEAASSFTAYEAEILKKFFLEMIEVMERGRVQRGALLTVKSAPVYGGEF